MTKLRTLAITGLALLGALVASPAGAVVSWEG